MALPLPRLALFAAAACSLRGGGGGHSVQTHDPANQSTPPGASVTPVGASGRVQPGFASSVVASAYASPRASDRGDEPQRSAAGWGKCPPSHSFLCPLQKLPLLPKRTVGLRQASTVSHDDAACSSSAACSSDYYRRRISRKAASNDDETDERAVQIPQDPGGNAGGHSSVHTSLHNESGSAAPQVAPTPPDAELYIGAGLIDFIVCKPCDAKEHEGLEDGGEKNCKRKMNMGQLQNMHHDDVVYIARRAMHEWTDEFCRVLEAAWEVSSVLNGILMVPGIRSGPVAVMRGKHKHYQTRRHRAVARVFTEALSFALYRRQIVNYMDRAVYASDGSLLGHVDLEVSHDVILNVRCEEPVGDQASDERRRLRRYIQAYHQTGRTRVRYAATLYFYDGNLRVLSVIA